MTSVADHGGSRRLRAAFLRGFRKGALQGTVVGAPSAIVVLLGYGNDLGALVGLLIFLPMLAVGVVGLQRKWWL